jgi:hypothetical protein
MCGSVWILRSFFCGTNQQYRIKVTSATPMRGITHQVMGHWVKINGDKFSCDLPYVGRDDFYRSKTIDDRRLDSKLTFESVMENYLLEREPLKNALIGLSHLIRHIAPMYLMCAPQDISVVYHVKDTFTGRPTIYLYDAVPGGIGLSDRVYEMDRELFLHAREMLRACPCADGCPSCVGATAGPGAKGTLLQILDELLDGQE